MDAFALNGSTVNGWGSLAAIVLLPASTATFNLALNERIAVSMEGSMGFSIDTIGDISKVVNIGDAPTAINFAVVGDLAKFQTVTFGPSPIGFGFDMVGAASTVILGPSGNTGFGLDAVGALVRRLNMQGASLSDFTPAARLHSVRYLGSQSASYALDSTGYLLRTGNMAGVSAKSFVLTGPLSQGVRNYMVGDIPVVFTPIGKLITTGGLSGNAEQTTSLTGSLNKGYRVQLPTAATGLSMQPTGAMQANQRMSGAVTRGFTTEGALLATRYMQGTSTVVITPSGGLANNAMGMDLDSVLMVRPESQREMTR